MTDGTLEEDTSLKVPANPEGIEPKVEEVEDVDRELADWFNVDLKPPAPEDSETEAESDADSNNDDVKEEDLDDEWFRVPEVPRDSGIEPLDDNVRDLNRCLYTWFTDCLTVKYYSPFTITGKDFFLPCFLLSQWHQDVIMGEDQAREYDTVAIFRHL